VNGVGVGVDARVRGRVGGGVAGLARVVRLLTAVVLLGAVLLVIALVGQGVATAREAVVVPREPADGGNLADLLRTSARLGRAGAPDLTAPAPGTGAGNPDLARALVDADEVLRRPGPAGGTGPPGADRGAGASPGAPDRSDPRGREGGATVPPLGQARKPELVAEAPQLVADDGGPLPGGPGPAARTRADRADDALVVAQATRPTVTPPTSPHTVTGIVDSVDARAESLAAVTKSIVGAPHAPHALRLNELVEEAARVSEHAAAARAHEQNQKLAEARRAMDHAILSLDRLSRNAQEKARILRDRGEFLRGGAEIRRRAVEKLRQDLEGYGASTGQGTPEGSSPTPRSIAAEAVETAKSVVAELKLAAPEDVADPTFTELVEQLQGHARAAASYEEFPWWLLYSSAAGLKDARAAVDALDQVVVKASGVGDRKRTEGDQLGLAADSGMQTVQEARRGADNLPRPPGKGSWLDEEPSPAGRPVRHADGDEPARVTPAAAVEGGDGDGSAPRVPVVLDAGSGKQGNHAVPVQSWLAGDERSHEVVASDALGGAGHSDPFANDPGSGIGPVAAGSDPVSSPVSGGDLADVDAGDPTYAGSLFG
jgi:hypothetical protein